jgi:CspA family cold shock protein
VPDLRQLTVIISPVFSSGRGEVLPLGSNGSFSFGRMLKNLYGKPEAVSEHAPKWFDAQKGFGFIERPDGSDIFVHYSDIVGSGFRTLTEGQKVQFEVSQSPKGPQAVKVTRVD